MLLWAVKEIFWNYNGIKLLPVLYEKYNPIPTRKDAENIEFILGKTLRLKHFGVWFN